MREATYSTKALEWTSRRAFAPSRLNPPLVTA